MAMQLVKIALVSAVIALVTVGVSNQITTAKYPPCDLVVKGVGVPTYGCSGNVTSQNYPCKDLQAESDAMKQCVAANYYRYKTFPFGFKQKFGPHSNLIDTKPKYLNGLATFGTALVVSFGLLLLGTHLLKRKPRAQHSEDE
jgi:hypothetical protein